MKRQVHLWLMAFVLLTVAFADLGCSKNSKTPTEPSPPPPKPLVLPEGVKKLAIGKAFNNQQNCEIMEPLSLPIQFPGGTIQFAYQLVIDPEKVQSVQISLKGEGLEGGLQTVFCDKYLIILGAPRQSQWGGTINRPGGAAFRAGTYTLTFTVDGNSVEVPFEIK